MKRVGLALIGLLFSLLAPICFAEPSGDLPPSAFRDLMISNHFNPQTIGQQTIGIEVEAGGIPEDAVIQNLLKEFGGNYTGPETHLGERAHVIRGTSIGDIRVEPVNMMRFVNRWKAAHPNTVWDSRSARSLVEQFDRLTGTFEIVTDPLRYDQVQKFAKAMDQLGLAGARGTSPLRLVSTQVNHGIDPTNITLIKNLLANYYGNHEEIRADIAPSPLRTRYIKPITPEFLAKLRDPNWKPTAVELYDEYLANSADKLSSLNLFNALITHQENWNRVVQPELAKPRLPRPVAEFREANTKMSTAKQPEKASRSIMREVDFALALVAASHETGQVTFESEVALAKDRLANSSNSPRGPPWALPPTLRETLLPQFQAPLVTKPIPDADIVLSNSSLLTHWGITGTEAEVRRQLLTQFGVEVDNSIEPTGTISTEPGAAFATAHDDGAGGRGDGRSINLAELEGRILNAKGIGLTPYQLRRYAVLIGFHIGGVDGRASLSEGLRSYITGELLHGLGISTERVAFLIDNKATSVHGDESEPSAVIVRELPGGGVRNSHLRQWDANQTRKGLDYLKLVSSYETGVKQTDTTFVMMDARKTAAMAARLQDAYIEHGALTAGNVLAYPGMVDLNTVKFLEAPDPAFTPIAQRSRFGNQAEQLKRLMLVRQQAYARVNPSLKGINAGNLFDEAFRRELSLLALERLGLDREVATKLYASKPQEVDAYTKKLWEAQFGHLHTDMQAFQGLIGQRNSTTRPDTLAARILKETTDPNRNLLEARRPWMQRLDHWWHGRESSLPQTDADELVRMALELIRDGSGLSTESSKPFRRNVAERAKAVASRKLPSNEQITEVVDRAVEAKANGADLKTAIAEVQHLVRPTDDPALLARFAQASDERELRERSRLEEVHAARFSGDLVEVGRLENHIRILAGEKDIKKNVKLSNRHSEGNKQLVREYITRNLERMKYEPETIVFRNGEGREGKNIIAEIKGNTAPLEVIEIVVHYDSANPLAVGADDNASGVAAGLEIARVQKLLNPGKTIRIVFTDFEETGLEGAEAHVKRRRSGEKLVAAFAVDTIGHNADRGTPKFDMVVGTTQANKDVANKILAQEARYNGRPIRVFPVTVGSHGDVSDIGPYWDANLPGLFFRQDYEDFSPRMHTSEDNGSLINVDYTRNVTGTINEMVSVLAESKFTDDVRGRFQANRESYEAALNPKADPSANYLSKARPGLSLILRLARLANWTFVKNRLERRRLSSDENQMRVFGEELTELRRAALERDAAVGLDEAAIKKRFAKQVEAFLRKWDLASPDGVDRAPGQSAGLENCNAFRSIASRH